jgi:thiol-disulfide isomerase/thioredoxin
VTELNGHRRELQEFHGQPLLLYFWASWWPPCRSELKVIEELSKEDDMPPILSVANLSGPPSQIRAYLRREGLRIDAVSGNRELRERFAIANYPSFVLLDSEGKVRNKFAGSREIPLIVESAKKLIHIGM